MHIAFCKTAPPPPPRYAQKVMVVELTERVCQYCQLQMAARLTMRNQEQAITRERKRFENKESSRDPIGKFNLLHTHRMLALE